MDVKGWLSAAVAAGSVAVVLGGGWVRADERPPGEVTVVEPCRLLDTRLAGDAGRLGPDETIVVPVVGDVGECVGVPIDVIGVEVQLTSVGAPMETFLTAYPANLSERPNSS